MINRHHQEKQFIYLIDKIQKYTTIKTEKQNSKTNKMRISNPEDEKFKSGNFEIKYNNYYYASHYKSCCFFTFPEEFIDNQYLLDETKLNSVGCENNSNFDTLRLKYDCCGYSYSLRSSLIRHHVYISSTFKYQMIECYLHQLLTLVTSTPLPSFDLDDFFVNDERGLTQAFGEIKYFVDLTRPSSEFFYKNSKVPNATIEDVKNVVNEFAKIVGINEKCAKSECYQFVKRLQSMTDLTQILNDEYYIKIGYRRKNVIHLNPPFKGEKNDENYIGHGTFGDVFKYVLYDNNQQIPIAIKIPSYTGTNNVSLSILERLNEREYNIGLAINGLPSVISFMGETPIEYNGKQQKAIIMKYYPESLEKYISRKLKDNYYQKAMIEINFIQSIVQMIDVLTGSLSLISMGILHRDYKTENVLVDLNERCYITDFGTSLALSQTNDGKTGIGTQQTFPKDHLSTLDKTSSDLYGIGLILASFFTSQHFFDAIEKTGEIGKDSRIYLTKMKFSDEKIDTFAKEFKPKLIHMLADYCDERATWFDVSVYRQFLIHKLEEYGYSYQTTNGFKFESSLDLLKKIVDWLSIKVRKCLIPHINGLRDLQLNLICENNIEITINILKSVLFYTSEYDMKEEYEQAYWFLNEMFTYNMIRFNKDSKKTFSFFESMYFRYMELC